MNQAISMAPTSTSQDQTLLEQIERRDTAALSALYDRYAGHVYQLALTVTHDNPSAEEATMDTFMEVWSQPERFRSSDIPLSKQLLATAWRYARHWRDEKLSKLPSQGAIRTHALTFQGDESLGNCAP